jgi:secondary thiamine-phosphate synthase enzyme
MRQSFNEFQFSTRGRGFYEVTPDIVAWLVREQVGDGLLTLHLRHTSASLLIQENADPDVRADLERFFARLVRDGDSSFQHTVEGPDDMPAHIRTALTSVNLSLPVRSGRMTLGTWQGVYLWEHRRYPHTRRLAAHYLGE